MATTFQGVIQAGQRVRLDLPGQPRRYGVADRVEDSHHGAEFPDDVFVEFDDAPGLIERWDASFVTRCPGAAYGPALPRKPGEPLRFMCCNCNHVTTGPTAEGTPAGWRNH